MKFEMKISKQHLKKLVESVVQEQMYSSEFGSLLTLLDKLTRKYNSEATSMSFVLHWLTKNDKGEAMKVLLDLIGGSQEMNEQVLKSLVRVYGQDKVKEALMRGLTAI